MMTMQDIYNNAQRAVYARCAEQKRTIQQYETKTTVDYEAIAGVLGFAIAFLVMMVCLVM